MVNEFIFDVAMTKFSCTIKTRHCTDEKKNQISDYSRCLMTADRFNRSGLNNKHFRQFYVQGEIVQFIHIKNLLKKVQNENVQLPVKKLKKFFF